MFLRHLPRRFFRSSARPIVAPHLMAASARSRSENGEADEASPVRELPTATRTTLTHEVVWTIERFSQLKPGVGNKVSKTFRFAGHEWMLSLYPDGCAKEYAGFCGVFLRLMSPGTDTLVDYRMTMGALGGGRQRPGAAAAATAGPGNRDGGAEASATTTNVETVTAADGKRAARHSSPGAVTTAATGIHDAGAPQPCYTRAAERRRFNSCDKGAKVSWGFPTYIRRQSIADMRLLSGRGGQDLVVRVQLDTSIMAVKIETGGARGAAPRAGAGAKKPPRPEMMAAAAKVVAAEIGRGVRPGTAG